MSFFAVTHTWTHDKPTTSTSGVAIARPTEAERPLLPWPSELPRSHVALCSVYDELKMKCYRHSFIQLIVNCDWFVTICNHLWGRRRQQWQVD